MAAATTSSPPKTSPHRPKALLDVTIKLARSYREDTSWKKRLAARAQTECSRLRQPPGADSGKAG